MLVLLQRFDESFGDTLDGVGWLVSAPATLRAGLQAAAGSGDPPVPSAVRGVSAAVMERAFACALAVVELRTRLGNLAAEWELVEVKAGAAPPGGAHFAWNWLVRVADGLVAALPAA
ncbi:hypothetical protein HK405_003404 [Cladochytrium tenue]|nr:hypothetical protein HK405_003404 [Cladochytrium tenue]